MSEKVVRAGHSYLRHNVYKYLKWKNCATSPDTSNSEQAALIIPKLKHQWICQVVQVFKSVY